MMNECIQTKDLFRSKAIVIYVFIYIDWKTKDCDIAHKLQFMTYFDTGLLSHCSRDHDQDR